MVDRADDRRGRPALAGRRSVALAALLVAAATSVARADNVDVLLTDLKSGRDYKVRLSAALSLAKLADPRAIPGLLVALEDSDRTVRGAALVGLGKLVDGTVPEATRKKVVAALDKLTKGDPADSLTKQAIKLRDTLVKLTSAAPVAGGMYIELSPMSAKAKGAEGLRELMLATVQKGLTKLDSKIMLTWPTGKAPTQKDLDRAKMTGFYIDGNVQDLQVTPKGSATVVSCKVSMLIATFPSKSIFGFLEGGAKVQGSNTAKDIALAKQDCVRAVVEDLVARKIMPTIRTKAGS